MAKYTDVIVEVKGQIGTIKVRSKQMSTLMQQSREITNTI